MSLECENHAFFEEEFILFYELTSSEWESLMSHVHQTFNIASECLECISIIFNAWAMSKTESNPFQFIGCILKPYSFFSLSFGAFIVSARIFWEIYHWSRIIKLKLGLSQIDQKHWARITVLTQQTVSLDQKKDQKIQKLIELRSWRRGHVFGVLLWERSRVAEFDKNPSNSKKEKRKL